MNNFFKKVVKESFGSVREKELTLVSYESPNKRTPLLTKIYSHKDLRTRSLTGFIAGLILAIALKFFIKEAHLYTGGVTGLAQGTSMLLFGITDNEKLFDILYWVLYAALNMPLIIFGFFKVGRRFTFVSLIVVFSTSIWGLTLDHIPGIKDFHLFPDNKPIDVLYYAILAAIFYPVGIAIAFLSGASSGGTDFLVTYYSVKKSKSVGGIMIYVSLTTILLSVLIGDFIGGGLAKNNPEWDIRKILSKELILSIVTMFFVATIVDILFPKQKKLEVSIITRKPDKIITHLKLKEYLHTLTGQTVVGTFSNTTKTSLSTVCSYMEKDWLIKSILEADEQAFITIKKVYSIVGNFKVKKVD